MAKLWAFGDSFCQLNENYINTIFKKGKFSGIEILGVSGSSLYYTLTMLDEYSSFIKSEDSVLVGITGTTRHFFKNTHFCKPTAHYFDRESKGYLPNTNPDMLQSYKMFLTYLNDTDQDVNLNRIFTYYIESAIKTKIECKNFIMFSTINSVDFPSSKHFGMWETVNNFYKIHLGYTDMSNEEILDKVNTPNHWIDHPEYEEYFWKNYNTLFEQLWA